MMQIPMDEAGFEALAVRAKANGVELTGREGVIEKMGVKAQWAFNGSELTVDVLEKPFWMTRELVEGKLKELL